MQRQLLIDADVLVYASAFSAQKTIYTYGNIDFTDAEEAKEYCLANNLDYRSLRKEGAITSRVEVLPEKVARLCYLAKLNNILDVCGSTRYTLFLSGDGNFRHNVATTKGYKANREKQPKPVHYQLCREMVQNDRCVMVDGMEADDAIGIVMSENPEAVVCTIDKDLLQIPGRHYVWSSGLKCTISPPTGLYWFHVQALAGDAVDNIPGIPGIGLLKAAKLLAGTRDNPVAGFDIVKDAYSSMDSGYLEEQGRLLWILRKPDEVWTPQYYEETYLNGT